MDLKNYITSQILIFGAYVKVKESSCAQVIVWVNTILNYDELGQYLPRYEGSCLVYRPKSHREQKYHQTPTP